MLSKEHSSVYKVTVRDATRPHEDSQMIERPDDIRDRLDMREDADLDFDYAEFRLEETVVKIERMPADTKWKNDRPNGGGSR